MSNINTELSSEEYADLLTQIQTELSVEDCHQELLDAARYDDFDVVCAILQCHPGIVSYQEQTTGNSALHMAAANGHKKVVALLLSQGANAGLTNKKGNTALHWAATNGKKEVVELILKEQKVDVLQRNQFGRSVLTEGFSSENTEVVQSLLEHESAAEERLMESTSSGDPDMDSSIVHSFAMGSLKLKVRELAIAQSSKDSILGQENPEDDTTGLGIWASSIVCAQWLERWFSQRHDSDSILELGAGCGVPGLVAALSKPEQTVYLTDFNPRTVANLQHNVKLNGLSNAKVLNMNWQDSSTWPKEKVDVVIGSDLIYQSDMVPLLTSTLQGLMSNNGTFLYVAPESGRQGQDELFSSLESCGFRAATKVLAPLEYMENPLASQDGEEFFLHFNDLQNKDIVFILYEFVRSNV